MEFKGERRIRTMFYTIILQAFNAPTWPPCLADPRRFGLWSSRAVNYISHRHSLAALNPMEMSLAEQRRIPGRELCSDALVFLSGTVRTSACLSTCECAGINACILSVLAVHRFLPTETVRDNQIDRITVVHDEIAPIDCARFIRRRGAFPWRSGSCMRWEKSWIKQCGCITPCQSTLQRDLFIGEDIRQILISSTAITHPVPLESFDQSALRKWDARPFLSEPNHIARAEREPDVSFQKSLRFGF